MTRTLEEILATSRPLTHLKVAGGGEVIAGLTFDEKLPLAEIELVEAHLRRTHGVPFVVSMPGAAYLGAGGYGPAPARPLTHSVMCACLANDGVLCDNCVERAQAGAP